MDRRSFLRVLALGAASVAIGATIDPERLLWVPGAKKIFLPPAKPVVRFSDHFAVGDVFVIEGRYAVNPQSLKSTGQLQQFVVTGFSESDSVNIAPYPQAEFWPAFDLSMPAPFAPKRKNWDATPIWMS